MALQRKYYYTFKDINDLSYLTEIWQNTTVTITEELIRADESPFKVIYPEVSNKFEPVRGSGCSIILLSESNMKFTDLYTADFQEYQIRLYLGTNPYTNNLIWCGYLDSELYTEPFAELNNYPVSLTGNDGFGILDRLSYVNDDNSNYSGITSQWEIMKRIFNRINLPFNSINSSLWYYYSIDNVVIQSGETIFHNVYIKNANFYDEDGTPFTLRKVLESILKPYGAYIIQLRGDIFILDNNSIAKDIYDYITVKKYNITTFDYIDTEYYYNKIGDISDIKLAESDFTYSIVSAYNKEIISYSPYKIIDLVNLDATKDFSFPLTAITYGSSGFTWKETFYDSGVTFDRYPVRGQFVNMQGLDSVNSDVKESYLKLTNSVPNNFYSPSVYNKGYLTFSIKSKDLFIVNDNSNYSLKVEMSIFPRFLDDLNNAGESHSKEIILIHLHTDISIGDKHFSYLNYYNAINNPYPPFTKKYWVDSGSTEYAVLNFYNYSDSKFFQTFDDTWLNLKNYVPLWDGVQYNYTAQDFIIPLDSSLYGDFNFNIYGYTCYKGFLNSEDVYCSDVRLKDIKFTIVDSLGNTIKDLDVEYVGTMNKQYKNEGNKIDLMCGTNLDSYPIERGGMIGKSGSTYYYIQSINKYYSGYDQILENHLLNSFESNYYEKAEKLTCKINLITPYNYGGLKGGIIGRITYENYLPSKYYTITANEIDYYEATQQITLETVKPDNLTINKSF